jgi:hypothetical protein
MDCTGKQAVRVALPLKTASDKQSFTVLVLVLIAVYFTHCSQSIPEAVITAVPAPDDGCQHPEYAELPTEM